MASEFRTVRACAAGAVRGFSWREYVPFAWLLVADALFLLLAQGLGTPWGMATAGRLAALVGGDAATHYPGFFAYLPVLFSQADAAFYTFGGAFLVPLGLSRILARLDPALGTGREAWIRARRAVVPTLAGFIASLALLYAWQWALPRTISPLSRTLLGDGFGSAAATWGVGILVGSALAALVYYVPIGSVRLGLGGAAAVASGVRDGLRLLPATLLLVLVFSLPALAVQFLLQAQSGFIVTRLRPETVAGLLIVYAALANVATYLSYAAAARLHRAPAKEGA